MFFALFIVSLVVVGHRCISSFHNIHTDFFFTNILIEHLRLLEILMGNPFPFWFFHIFTSGSTLFGGFMTYCWYYGGCFLPYVGPSVILDNIQVPYFWNVYSFILFSECLTWSLLEFFAVGGSIHQHQLNPFLYNVSLCLFYIFSDYT